MFKIKLQPMCRWCTSSAVCRGCKYFLLRVQRHLDYTGRAVRSHHMCLLFIKAWVQILQCCFTAKLQKFFVETSPVFPSAQREEVMNYFIFEWTFPLAVSDLQPESVQKHLDRQRHAVLCEMRHLLEVFRLSFLNNTNYVSHTNPQFGNFFFFR